MSYKNPTDPVGMEKERLRAENKRLREAINEALYALYPNQGEKPDTVLAGQWLYSTWPKDHPCYRPRPHQEESE